MNVFILLKVFWNLRIHCCFCFFKGSHQFAFFKKVNLKNFSNINNMGNRTTTQKPCERETKQSQYPITPFQTLKELPKPLWLSQCVSHKHELIICGGYDQRSCYSYHKLRNEYKFICEYPSDIKLRGHCVIKLVENNCNNGINQITLLSFGGYNKHTLLMKYVSVWSNISNKSNELSNYNQWIPFANNNNDPIVIGSDENHFYLGARAVIGGSNSHLLFITYQLNNISVFNLNIFQFIKHDRLPTNYIQFHCFASNSENGQGQEMMMKTNQEKKKQNYQMLFCQNTGLLIEYDENSNNFQFDKHKCRLFLEQCYVIKLNNTLSMSFFSNYALIFRLFHLFRTFLYIPLDAILDSCFFIIHDNIIAFCYCMLFNNYRLIINKCTSPNRTLKNK
ncbi:hypothetical protein RFI_29378 [Reticulomyxa filosa]|uniref:Uncharacterized protein n=1 Tax=Reticulomyxa filosa TaxID=46433 RepID=X6M3H1_RETFI|nr:hypothetical protein RFI_29378 [Reticulomyxa filosa]|eukprot:ETO08012.1 hypothetical protein RFI_29378 [Reticulomyxa filosa]